MAKKIKKSKTSPSRPVSINKKAAPTVREAVSTRWKLAIGIMMAVLAMAVYAPSINYDFVYDDDAVIKDNRYVKQGIEGLDEIWSTSYFQGYDENMNARAFRPIPLTTLAFEVEMFGLNTKVHHGTNLLFYGLTGFFLFLLLVKLMRGYHLFLPIATCLLFILHPIHLEVVANIKSRDTMLGFLGVCVAAWLLLKHLDTQKILPLGLSLVFYFVALFSKEEVITTLAGIPLMLWFFRDYKMGKIARTMLPYLGAVIIFLIYRSNIVGGLNEGVTLTYLDNSLLAANGLGERSASQIFVLGNYLLKTVFPHPLISDYSFSTLPIVNWNDWRVYVALFSNIALLWVGIKGLIRKEIYAFGPLWYFVSVSIFTSLVVTNVSAYNDRFLYVPVLGIIFLIVWALLQLVKKLPSGQTETVSLFFKNNFVPVAVVMLLAAISIYKIEGHLPYWKDRNSLFLHDVELAPKNARMRKNYGGSLARLAVEYQVNDPALARQYAELAIEQLNYALSLYPGMPTGHIHKGNMHILLNQNDEAIEALNTALVRDPQNYYAKASLGNVYYRKGEYENSIKILESIPKHLRNPSDLDVLARSYDKIGNNAKAAEIRAGK